MENQEKPFTKMKKACEMTPTQLRLRSSHLNSNQITKKKKEVNLTIKPESVIHTFSQTPRDFLWTELGCKERPKQITKRQEP